MIGAVIGLKEFPPQVVRSIVKPSCFLPPLRAMGVRLQDYAANVRREHRPLSTTHVCPCKLCLSVWLPPRVDPDIIKIESRFARVVTRPADRTDGVLNYICNECSTSLSRKPNRVEPLFCVIWNSQVSVYYTVSRQYWKARTLLDLILEPLTDRGLIAHPSSVAQGSIRAGENKECNFRRKIRRTTKSFFPAASERTNKARSGGKAAK